MRAQPQPCEQVRRAGSMAGFRSHGEPKAASLSSRKACLPHTIRGQMAPAGGGLQPGDWASRSGDGESMRGANAGTLDANRTRLRPDHTPAVQSLRIPSFLSSSPP